MIDMWGEGTGRSVPVEWHGMRVAAWVPATLRDRDLSLDVRAVRAAERAVAALRLAEQRFPVGTASLGGLLLRHEGMASSGIEGLRESVVSVLAADRSSSGGGAGWIADNLAVIDMALQTAQQPLRVEMLHGWHERLMRHGDLPESMVGTIRPALGWIGGTSPLDASYVPPPPEEIPRLLDDLVRFADVVDDLDAVTRAAIAHAQFEAIHPYGDGNGRLGRALVSRILRRAGTMQQSVAPISLAIENDRDGYLSGLALFNAGCAEPWVRWFAEVAQRSAVIAENIVERSVLVVGRWESTVSRLRRDSAARALLPFLSGHPLVSSADVARLLGVTERTGRNALASLAELGIIERTPVSTGRVGRARRWYAATDALWLSKT